MKTGPVYKVYKPPPIVPTILSETGTQSSVTPIVICRVRAFHVYDVTCTGFLFPRVYFSTTVALSVFKDKINRDPDAKQNTNYNNNNFISRN